MSVDGLIGYSPLLYASLRALISVVAPAMRSRRRGRAFSYEDLRLNRTLTDAHFAQTATFHLGQALMNDEGNGARRYVVTPRLSSKKVLKFDAEHYW